MSLLVPMSGIGVRIRATAATTRPCAPGDAAAQAGRQALERANLQPTARIDRLVLSAPSGHAISQEVQESLKVPPCPAVCISPSNAGFLHGLDWGARAVLTGEQRALVIAADTCAGAVVLERGWPEEGLLALIQMAGSGETFDAMAAAAKRILEEVGLSEGGVSRIVPHRPDRTAADRLSDRLDVPRERIFVDDEHPDDLTGASLAVAFHQAGKRGALEPGGVVLLLSYTGAAIVRWPE
jgi:3-oxoacyl-[acyl-carrier-protein] synthase III